MKPSENEKIHPVRHSKYEDKSKLPFETIPDPVLKYVKRARDAELQPQLAKVSQKLFADISTATAAEKLQFTVPRRARFEINDPRNPTFSMMALQDIISVLEYRRNKNPTSTAHICIDKKGKEAVSYSWDKILNRAKQFASVAQNHVGLKPGTRVILYYRKSEASEYIISIFGCLLLGIVVIPLSPSSSSESLKLVVNEEKVRVAFTTEATYRIFIKDTEVNNAKSLAWWKSNDFTNYKFEQIKQYRMRANDTVLIDYTFSSSTYNDIKAVYTTKTFLSQMRNLTSSMITNPARQAGWKLHNFEDSKDVLITNFHPSMPLGLIMGVFNSVFAGYCTIFCDEEVLKTPGLLAYLITKYRCTYSLFDYAGLKQTVYNYQEDPKSTLSFKKNYTPNLSSLKLCMVECEVVDPEFNIIVSDRWLQPLGTNNSKEVITPILCLRKFGGIPISFKDWMISYTNRQKHERQMADTCYQEILVLKSSIEKEKVEIVPFLDIRKYSPNEVLCMSPFWYPIPEASVAVVNEDSKNICKVGEVGEIWVYSDCLPKLKAASVINNPQGEQLTDYENNQENKFEKNNSFMDSGLKGFLHNEKIFVLGNKDEQIRQYRKTMVADKLMEEKYVHYSHYLIKKIMKYVPEIFDGVAFEIEIDKAVYSVLVLESPIIKRSLIRNNRLKGRDLFSELVKITESSFQVTQDIFKLDVLSILIAPYKSLPRSRYMGIQAINTNKCKLAFLSGNLPVSYVRFFMDSALPKSKINLNNSKGIWSKDASKHHREIISLNVKQKMDPYKHQNKVSKARENLLNHFTILDFLKTKSAKTPTSPAILTFNAIEKTKVELTWAHFELKVASHVEYMQLSVKAKARSHILLLYYDPLEFLISIHSCFHLGVIPIPFQIREISQLIGEIEEFTKIAKAFNVEAILVDHKVLISLKSRDISNHFQQTCIDLNMKAPKIFETTGIPISKRAKKALNLITPGELNNKGKVALISINKLEDGSIIPTQFSHSSLLAFCHEQKEFVIGNEEKPIIGGIEFSSGMGLLHTALLGVYAGVPTLLIKQENLCNNGSLLFEAIEQNSLSKVMIPLNICQKSFSTAQGCNSIVINSTLSSIIVPCYDRPISSRVNSIIEDIARIGLAPNKVKLAYSHPINPFVCWNADSSMEKMKDYFDANQLRSGLVNVREDVLRNRQPLLYGSGTSTLYNEICIVHPEEKYICQEGEIGEIWINGKHGSYCENNELNSGCELLVQETLDKKSYSRTGQLGFIHHLKKKDQNMEKVPVLYTLDFIWNTLELNGLNHSVKDIEETIELVHPNICTDGCILFQASGSVVILLEVHSQQKFASLIPIIVATALAAHEIILDCVAFVPKGTFLRRPTGEKRRADILKQWTGGDLKHMTSYLIRQDFLLNEDFVGTELIGTTDSYDYSDENLIINSSQLNLL
nr:putative AMP binding enzyme [Schizosaccharomyces pombe]CAA91069.1 AMP binding enzyme (predicted) [Schizosaccharomyces pombe]|eukprot:NP_593037.1 putative AMP binding enzyme [Schizosaccharomyces pombe]